MKTKRTDKYASDEELFFSYYIGELLNNDYLIEVEYQPTPFELCPKSAVPTSGKPFTSMQRKIYTADWKLRWHPRARDIFFTDEKSNGKTGFFYAQNGVSIVDIKGEAFRMSLHTSDVTFPDRQSLIWNRDGIYVQAVKISYDKKSLFGQTFTPQILISSQIYRRDTKDHTAGETKFRFRPYTLNEFVTLNNK